MKIISKFDYSKILYSKENNINLLVRATAPKIEIDADKRKPLNIVTAVDTSGSMMGDKIDYAKKSLLKLIDHLSPVDTLAIIEFSTQVRVVSKSVKMTSENKEKLKVEVRNLQPTSSTNFSGALFQALELASDVDGDCRVIMFTDGQANVGVTDSKTLITMLDSKLKSGVTITNFGYGNDHSAEFLTELSKAGAGNYAFVKNPDDALTAFALELGGLLSCYGQNLTFTVKPKSGIKISAVVSDVDVEEDGDVVKIIIPDIYSEESKNLILEVQVPEQQKLFPRSTTLVDVELSYVEATTGDKKRVEAKAKVQFVDEESDVTEDKDQTFIDQLALAKLMRAQEQASIYAKAGNFSAAQNVMGSVSAFFANASNDSGDIFREASSYYDSSEVYACSMNNVADLRNTLRSGRGMTEKAFRNEALVMTATSFTAPDSQSVSDSQNLNLGVQNNLSNADYLTGLVNNPTTENKKSLTKKRSEKEW